GLDPEASRALRQSMRQVGRWSWLSDAQRRGVRRRFAAIAGVRVTSAVDSGQALLLLGGNATVPRTWTRALRSILGDALSYSQTVAKAERQEAQLDMGLAWTAHELRGPLLSARMAIDLAFDGAQPDDPLASLAKEQLDSLAGRVDDLLHWSVGARRPRRGR